MPMRWKTLTVTSVTTPPGAEGLPPPLDADRLNQALRPPAGCWREIRVVGETGSTNADLLAQARAGSAEGLVLAAGAQTAGRGRLGRQWVSPPHAALTFSVLLRPQGVPAGLLGWLPLLAGVAVVSALRAVTGLDTRLKWPNDVLAGEAKLAGMLAEGWGGAIVLGVGINVFQQRPELPVPAATSLLLEKPGLAPDTSERLLVAVLGELARWYSGWRDQARPGDADGCGLRRAYLRRCATVGWQVTVTMPGGRVLTGTAAGVDPAGQLEVRTGPGLVCVSAGDVVHVR